MILNPYNHVSHLSVFHGIWNLSWFCLHISPLTPFFFHIMTINLSCFCKDVYTSLALVFILSNLRCNVTRIIQSLYYAPVGRYINAWMHSLKKSVKPEIVNRYDLCVLRHKIGGAIVFVNNVQWGDQMM